ncbi:MAG: YdcF family protein [Thermodesulfovibrionales bacterium]|nr:YdcF family protein [Thermodesulfovibrionales bacterium]
MFLIKKTIAAFLLPPGIFILLLYATGLWFLFRKKFAAGIINLCLGILIYVSSISPVSDFAMSRLESGLRIPSNPQGDVIILLGGGVYNNAPDMSGTGVPSGEMMGRMVTAVRLQKMLKVPVIISGGKIHKDRIAEAVIVKRFLIDLGVPANKTITEEISRDTMENAIYSSEICRKNNFKKPIVVTSAYHINRTVFSFKKANMNIIPFPANFKTWNNKKFEWKDYLPDISDLENTYTALHEYLGMLFYKLAY